MAKYSSSAHKKRLAAVKAQLAARGLDETKIKKEIRRLAIELPSWGFGDSGTRFGVFKQDGSARILSERMSDAALVNNLTGVCPTVAIHIPWDTVDDFKALNREAKKQGVAIGAVNPNVFQDECYKLGSLANVSAKVRKRALDVHLECCRIMKESGSKVLSLWYADGSNFPGQVDIIQRKHWFEEAFKKIHRALPANGRMLIEYKPFEPAFYHTDIADWGMAYTMANKPGPKAQVLVDIGHHLLGANIEHIVGYLIDEGMLGGFHLNNRKYADDDLTTGSINPYEVFLIFNEVIHNKGKNIALMVDQSHNIKPKMTAMIQTVMNIQRYHAQALAVDRKALAKARAASDVVTAENTLQEAFRTDVDALLEQVRIEDGRHPDPLTGYAESGYQKKIDTDRQGEIEGAASWG